MIKLINYGRYASREVFISKTMIHSMERNNDITNITMEGGCSYAVKETPEEILAMPDIEEGIKTIDWEQRRFDLVSALFVKYNCSPDNLHYLLNDIIPRADALIDELKKGGEK